MFIVKHIINELRGTELFRLSDQEIHGTRRLIT
jgi:hypothetical protein